MDSFTNGNGHRFWQGVFIGFVGWTSLLFHSGLNDLLGAIAKLIFSSFLAGASGLATMLLTDVYKKKWKHKLFKSKNNGNEKNKGEDQEAA